MTRNDLLREFGGTDFFKGVRYYNEHRVIRLEIQTIRQTTRLFAKVKGHAQRVYDVSAELGERSITCQCDCPQYNITGQCKHVVAVFLAYLDTLEQRQGSVPAEKPARKSDRGAQALIAQAEQLSIPEQSAPLEEQPVTLQPELSLSDTGTQPSLSLLIGRERLYVVKHIDEFLDAMEQHKTISYGKNLTLLHRPELLEGRSRQLYELVRQCQKEREMVLEKYMPYTYSYSYSTSIGRTIALPPQMLDRFFSLYVGSEVKLFSRRETVRLTERQPELPAFLHSEPDGMSLTLLQDCALCTGAERDYIFDGRVLFPCAPELAELAKTLRKSGEERQDANTIFFSKQDLPSLASTLLPVVKRYFAVEGDEDALTEYTPSTPTLQFYLDWDGAEVTAKLKAAYDGTVVNVYREEEHKDLRRNRLAERRGAALLERWFPETDENGVRRLTDEAQIYAFCRQGMEEFQACGEVYSSGALKRLYREQPKVSVGVSVSGGLLDLNIDAGDFPMSELLALADAVRSHKKYYRMKNGSFLSLEEGSSLTTLAGIQAGLGVSDKAFATGSISVPLYRALYLDESLRDAEQLRYSRDDGFRKLVRSFRTVADSDYVLPEQYRTLLRPYQKTGFRWLKTLAQYGFGGILADDMGLGKTVQALSYLSSEKEAGNPLPSLVVCPASLVLNWGDECHKFAPELRVQLLCGTATERARQWEQMNGCDLAVISYDSLRRDAAQLKKYSFHTCILDEAQYIKNHTTVSFQTIKQVNAQHRFAMTGTPVENRLSELWSIFDFLMPGYLYRYREFQSRIEKPAVKEKDEEALARLAKLTRPFLLRRMKSDVLKELPPKTESVRYVSLNEEQRKLYTAVAMDGLDQLRSKGSTGSEGQDKLAILVLLMRLRQICCDPRLCLDEYAGESAKLESCMELVSEAVESGHHILLFSQFTSMLELLRQRLDAAGISSFVLQGSTPKSKRANLVQRFNAGEAEVFLISLKAGGTGLNLTGADTVIHYDPWWNDAAQNQATDRAYRIGQKNAVQVYKLISKDTIEEKILDLQERKRSLADAVAGTETGILSLSREELLELLQV